MPEVLPAWPLFAAFLLASLVLAVTPGPGVFYIVTRSMAQGRRAGLASVAGVAAGNFGNALGASLGLAALFLASSTAFLLVKYAGAAYLVFLGLRAIFSGVSMTRGPSDVEEPQPDGSQERHQRRVATRLPEGHAAPRRGTAKTLRAVFRDGLVVALLNPKTAVFFAAFLPQFMRPDSSHALQSILLGAIFVAIAATTDTFYALAAGTLGPTVSRSAGLRSLGRYASGGAFIGLGLYTAFSGARAAK